MNVLKLSKRQYDHREQILQWDGFLAHDRADDTTQNHRLRVDPCLQHREGFVLQRDAVSFGARVGAAAVDAQVVLFDGGE